MKCNIHKVNQILKCTREVASITPTHYNTCCNRNYLEMHTSSGVSMALTHYNTPYNTLQQE